MPSSVTYRNIEQLQEKIEFLKRKQADQENQIRKSVKEVRDSLKPANLLRNGITSLISNNEARNSLLKAGAGMLASFLLKKYLGGNQGKAVAKVINAALNTGFSQTSDRNAGNLIEWAEALLQRLFSPDKKKEMTDYTDGV